MFFPIWQANLFLVGQLAVCCTVTLSDPSAAPGDSPTEEEIDSVCRFQPGKGRTQLRPLHEPQGCGGRAEGWGPSPSIPAPSSSGIQQVDCPIPTPSSPHSEKLAVAGFREDRSRQELFTTLLQGRLDFCWGWTAALTQHPMLSWEQYFEESSFFWTIFLVLVPSSRRRAGGVWFMRILMQYISSLLCTPFRPKITG